LGLNSDTLAKQDESVIEGVTNLIYGTAAISNYTLGHPNFEEILKASNETFDLLLLDLALTDSLLGVAKYYNIPAVVLNVGATNKWSNEMTGNPNNPSYNPNMFLGYTDRMSFTERVLNTMMAAFDELTYNFLYLPTQEAIYQRYFGDRIPNLPPLIDLVHNVSLVLLNSHPVVQHPRALMSNMVEVAGMHIHEPVEMSPDILEFIEAAKKGIIYVSFGSDLRFSDFPEEKVLAFLDAFENMTDYRMLVKWEKNVLPRQIHRMVIGPWMPQQEILAHPNVRAFITHGGLLSHIESIYYGKPIIGIPFSRDQELNVAQAVQNGCGVKLPFDSLTEATLKEALAEVINNTVYRTNALRMSKLFRAHQVQPIDKAIYHIEQVLEGRGAPHLRSVAVDLSFWQIQQIDVFLVILLVIVSVVAVPSAIIMLVLRRVNPSRTLVASPSRTTRKKAINGKQVNHNQQNQIRVHNNNLNSNHTKKKD
jgi:glucuronosyltransferase